MSVRQHVAHGLRDDAKGGDRCDVDRAPDRLGIDPDERSANALDGVVGDDDGRATKRQRGCIKQRVDGGSVTCIGHERRCAGIGGHHLEWLAPARRDHDAHSALARKGACEAGAKPGAGTNDQRAPVRRHGHAAPCEEARRTFCGNMACFASSSISAL